MCPPIIVLAKAVLHAPNVSVSLHAYHIDSGLFYSSNGVYIATLSAVYKLFN